MRLYEYIIMDDGFALRKEVMNKLVLNIERMVLNATVLPKVISSKSMRVTACDIHNSNRFKAFSFEKIDLDLSEKAKDLKDGKTLNEASEEQKKNVEGLVLTHEDFIVIDIQRSRIYMSRIFDTKQKARNLIEYFISSDTINLNILNSINEEFITKIIDCKAIKFQELNGNALSLDPNLSSTTDSLKKISESLNGEVSEVKITNPRLINKIKKLLKKEGTHGDTSYIVEISDGYFDYIFNSRNATLAIDINVMREKTLESKLSKMIERLEHDK